MVEHLTFNQVVRGSNPRTLTFLLKESEKNLILFLYLQENRIHRLESKVGILYNKLRELSESDFYPFHMPGHKRHKDITEADLPYELDITEIDGFDDLHHAEDILLEEQRKAADIFHADESHYLVNGSTVGLLSSILGVTEPGDTILIARNCHKSVYNAIYINQLNPIYIYPSNDRNLEYENINGEILSCDIKCMLEKNPEVRAVVVTSPTYEGVVSNIQEIANIVHANNIPLIVDEAHGSHLGFHKVFPNNSNVCGADLVIQSLHKTLPSMTQTAILHINGNIVDREKVRNYLHMLQSSSPSYVLMASMSECVALLKQKGNELFNSYVNELMKVRNKLKLLSNLKLVETHRYDISKIVIYSNENTLLDGQKLTGKLLYNLLRDEYKIQCEMSSMSYVVLMTSVADTKYGFRRLVQALEQIDRKLIIDTEKNVQEEENDQIKEQNTIQCRNEIYCNSRQVDSYRKEYGEVVVTWEKAEGRVSAEYAYVYPPGIPLIVPGEIISHETVESILHYERCGFKIEGTIDQNNIHVIEMNLPDGSIHANENEIYSDK